MGAPFLVLIFSSALIVIAILLVLYTTGEVIWAPVAQSLAAERAPAGQQGAYMGTFAATLPVGLTIGPMIGLQARSVWGDGAMWITNGVFTVAAAVVYALANRSQD
jgi:MFS family permease